MNEMRLCAVQAPRPEKVVYRWHHLCLDKGYDYADVIAGVEERDDILHLKRRGVVEPSPAPERRHPARRWVVERTHAWHNKFRRLLVRWQKKVTHYEAMIHLACVLVLYRLIVTSASLTLRPEGLLPPQHRTPQPAVGGVVGRLDTFYPDEGHG